VSLQGKGPEIKVPPVAQNLLALQVTDLGCVRGGRLVFSGISFRVERGQLLAVTGPNGSGKSSLLRLLAGLLRPETGRVRLEGAGEDAGAIHYLGHADGLKSAQTLRETLRFWATVYAQNGRVAVESDFDEAAGSVGLRHALELPVAVLSAGQRRRASLARFILSERPLWLLDEPLTSLDREGELMLGELVHRHRAGGGMVVAATHQDLPVQAHAFIRLGHQQ
jgi:heme exporter protein A